LADDLAALLGEIESLAASGGVDSTPLAWNDIRGASQSSAPLSPLEKAQGYARSYLAGPTFNYADNLEAMMTSLFSGKTTDQELFKIRDQQKRFKDKTDYLDNAVEIGSGLLLNPLDKLKKVKTATELPLLSTFKTLFTSAPSQAALASAGASDGKDVLENALMGAGIGTGLSAAASVGGKAIEDIGRGANRLKLSAYGIGSADISRQLKKLNDKSFIPTADDIPLVKTLNAAESLGIVDAGNDIIQNANNVSKARTAVFNQLKPILEEADAVSAPRVDFDLKHTLDFIEGLAGSAKDDALKAADDELAALLPQLKTGTIKDLQTAKQGLNYRFDQNAYKDDIIKAIRSDLRAEIEKRVDEAATAGLIPEKYAGKVRQLNSSYGNLSDLRDAFAKRAYKDLQGDVIEDVFGGMRTSSGTGSLNLASAQTGNPLWAALGAGLNAARVPEAKSLIADVVRDPAVGVPLRAIGAALPEVVTGRSVAQGRAALQQKPTAVNIPAKPEDILAEIEALATQGSSDIKKKGPSNPIIEGAFSPMEKAPIEITEQAAAQDDAEADTETQAAIRNIKADPYYDALAMTESSWNPKAKNPDSTAKGLFQFINSTAKSMGLDDPFDIPKSFEKVQTLTDRHKEVFGTDPLALYAAHYLGETVFRKYLNNKPLTPTQQAQVDYFFGESPKSPANRFKRNYEASIAKKDPGVVKV